MSIDWNARFETINDLYWKDTGYLRPGKSEPIGRDSNDQENRDRFATWMKKRAFDSAIDALTDSRAQLHAAIDILDEIAESPTLDDPRIGYVEIQIDRETRENLVKALSGNLREILRPHWSEK